jgi:hypothetical protein
MKNTFVRRVVIVRTSNLQKSKGRYASSIENQRNELFTVTDVSREKLLVRRRTATVDVI